MGARARSTSSVVEEQDSQTAFPLLVAGGSEWQPNGDASLHGSETLEPSQAMRPYGSALASSLPTSTARPAGCAGPFRGPAPARSSVDSRPHAGADGQ